MKRASARLWVAAVPVLAASAWADAAAPADEVIRFAAFPNLPDYAEYGQADLSNYASEFDHDPEFQRKVNRIFGSSSSVGLEERRKMAIGGPALSVRAYEGSEPYRTQILIGQGEEGAYIPELGTCQRIRCLVGTGYGFQIEIYQDSLPLAEVLLEQMQKVEARRKCEVAVAAEHRSLCEGREAQDLFAVVLGRDEDPLPSTYWVDAADGMALSWAPVAADDRENQSRIAYLSNLADDPLPEDCEDLNEYESQRDTLVACGAVRIARGADGSTLAYCLYQALPGLPPDFARCIPLYRQTRDQWSVAEVAARIVDEREPGGDVEDTSCTYESRSSLATDATRLAAAFEPLLKSNLAVRKTAEDSYLLSGSRINVDLRSTNRARPWAFVRVAIRIQGTEEWRTLISNISYTLSARPLTSRSDGREATEAESPAINKYFQQQLQRAIRQAGGRVRSCESTF